MNDTEGTPEVSSRMFQITEQDLATLERDLPDLLEQLNHAPGGDNNRTRTRIRRVQQVIVDVRWNYGPHSNVQRISADGDDQTPGTGAAV